VKTFFAKNEYGKQDLQKYFELIHTPPRHRIMEEYIPKRWQTKKMLEELGKKNETYDDIIKRLIEYYQKGEK
jgi:hypothetical protein